MNARDGDDPAAYLRALAAGLGKCGIPTQIRQDRSGGAYVRASHPAMPLSTDVYCDRRPDGTWSLRSEWGGHISAANDLVTAIGYVVTLLRAGPADPDAY